MRLAVVADSAGSGSQPRLLAGFGGEKARHLEDAGPDHPGVADQLEHHVLGKDAPALPASAFEHLVDHGHREHHHDHACGRARE